MGKNKAEEVQFWPKDEYTRFVGETREKPCFLPLLKPYTIPVCE